MELNAPEEAHYAPETEVAFAVGHQVGEAAQSLFPKGVLIGDNQELGKAIRQTQEILAVPWPLTLFEASASPTFTWVQVGYRELCKFGLPEL